MTVFALLFALGPVRQAAAAPRRVAIVNLAADTDAGARAADHIRSRLATTSALAAVPTGDLSRALEHALPKTSSVDAALASARGAVKRALEARARFDDAAAAGELARAERAVIGVEPTQEVRGTLAEINLQVARMHWLSDPMRALRHFRVARLLRPDLTSLDPTRFSPGEIKLFQRALAANQPTGWARVTASFDGAEVFVNGTSRGKAPLSLVLPTGIHYLFGRFPDQRPGGQRVVIESGKRISIKLELAPMSSEERARALRKKVIDQALPPGDATYRQTAQAAARISGVDAVIVVRADPRGAIRVASWDNRAGKLGAWRPLTAPAKEIFAVLLPKPVSRPPGGDIVKPPPPPVAPWYRRRNYQLAIGGSVAVTIMGILAYSLSRDGGKSMTTGQWGDVFPNAP